MRVCGVVLGLLLASHAAYALGIHRKSYAETVMPETGRYKNMDQLEESRNPRAQLLVQSEVTSMMDNPTTIRDNPTPHVAQLLRPTLEKQEAIVDQKLQSAQTDVQRLLAEVQETTHNIASLQIIADRVQQENNAAQARQQHEQALLQEQSANQRLAMMSEERMKEEMKKAALHKAAETTVAASHLVVLKEPRVRESLATSFQALVGTEAVIDHHEGTRVSKRLAGIELESVAVARINWNTESAVVFPPVSKDKGLELLMHIDLGLKPVKMDAFDLSLRVSGSFGHMLLGLTDGQKTWLLQRQPDSLMFFHNQPFNTTFNPATARLQHHGAPSHGDFALDLSLSAWGVKMTTSDQSDMDVSLISPIKPAGLASEFAIVAYRSSYIEEYSITQMDIDFRINGDMSGCDGNGLPALAIVDFQNLGVVDEHQVLNSKAKWRLDVDPFAAGGPYEAKDVYFHPLCLSSGIHDVLFEGMWGGATFSLYSNSVALLTELSPISSRPYQFNLVAAAAPSNTVRESLGCRDNCSDRGVCIENVCHCNEGYGGAICDRRVVPCTDGCVHGVCNLESGLCVCDHFWKSKICAEFACPNDCTGHGICRENGVCECDASYAGAFCDHIKRQCPNSCSQHGECFDGVCKCDPLFFGDDCSRVTVGDSVSTSFEPEPELEESSQKNPDAYNTLVVDTDKRAFDVKIGKKLSELAELQSKQKELQAQVATLAAKKQKLIHTSISYEE